MTEQNYYNVDLTIETENLTKQELENRLNTKLQKNVPEQDIDLVMISKIKEVEE